MAFSVGIDANIEMGERGLGTHGSQCGRSRINLTAKTQQAKLLQVQLNINAHSPAETIQQAKTSASATERQCQQTAIVDGYRKTTQCAAALRQKIVETHLNSDRSSNPFGKHQVNDV